MGGSALVAPRDRPTVLRYNPGVSPDGLRDAALTLDAALTRAGHG